jgi:hypothetical protein
VEWGPSVEVSYGAGRPARIDGTVSGAIAVEIESRTSKQVRGAVLDLLFHPYQKKLLVLVPMYMSDCGACADQCRNALGRYIDRDHLRVVVLEGTGSNPRLNADAQLVLRALSELGHPDQRSDTAPGLPGGDGRASRSI